MKRITLLLIGIFAFGLVNAQVQTPQPSQTAKFSTKIGLTEVTIDYSRPSKKGREIYGGLVPYGELWRTGANASTKISFGNEVMINDQKVPAGTYAIFTRPGKDSWEIILHKNLTISTPNGDGYKEEENLMKFNVKPVEMGMEVETFTISLGNNKMDQSDLYIIWDKTMVSFTIKASVDEMVLNSIDRTLNPRGAEYYRAGRYYLDAGKEAAKAKEYLEIACKKYDEEGTKAYWAYHQLAIAQKMAGEKKEAKESAEKSMEYAKERKADSYIKLNEELIKGL